MIYFMFHFGRSGSTVLTNSIGQHPNVFWHGEIFSKNVTIGDGFENTEYSKKQGDGEFTIEEFIEYIRNCMGFSNYKVEGNTIYGCEIKSYHFEFDKFKFTFTDCLKRLKEEFNCKFIFLERKNSLRRILSCQLANQSNVWHLSAESLETNTISVDVEGFKDVDLNYNGSLIDTLKNSSCKQVEYSNVVQKNEGLYLSYEGDIQHDVLKAINKLAFYMNIADFKPEIKFKKTNPSELKHMVDNYKVVEDSLIDSPFSEFLDN
jgi:hypothetical protein